MSRTLKNPSPVNSSARLPATLLALLSLAALWSAIKPHDLFTWFLETFPAFSAMVILTLTYRRFRLTYLLYVLIAFHCVILFIGGHYTYAEVPAFNWLRDEFHLSRNHYDRVGHFMQGFVPAMVARELLLRTSPLRPGKWLFALIALGCLGISAAYELLEWLVAEYSGDDAVAFLATQGDVWDTQKDMALAGAGAVCALLALSGVHNRQLQKLGAA